MRGPVPALRMVRVASVDWPTGALPKSTVGKIERLGAPAAAPMPDSATLTRGWTGSLLPICSVADWTPVALGLNVTVALCCAPGARLNTAVDPETPNCEGSLVVDKATMELMFSAAAPVLAMFTGRSFDCPIATDPKSRLPGVMDRLGPEAVVPVPVRGTVSDGCAGSLLAMVSEPGCAPLEVGAKRTGMVELAPAATVKGKGG